MKQSHGSGHIVRLVVVVTFLMAILAALSVAAAYQSPSPQPERPLARMIPPKGAVVPRRKPWCYTWLRLNRELGADPIAHLNAEQTRAFIDQIPVAVIFDDANQLMVFRFPFNWLYLIVVPIVDGEPRCRVYPRRRGEILDMLDKIGVSVPEKEKAPPTR